MSLGAHLAELRKRLTIAALALIAGMVAGFVLSDTILASVQALLAATDQRRLATLNFGEITSAFDLRLQIAFTVGVILSSPVWLYQLWAFIVPALNRREKMYALGFVGAAVPLFLAGCVAGWLVLPHMIALLIGFAPADSSSILNARSYVDFILRLTLIVGVAFVLPLLLVLLNMVGVMSAGAIIRSWRYVILAITCFTALATPAADVLSMLLLAAPMVLLYLVAAGVAGLNDKRRARVLSPTVMLPELIQGGA
ncbi:twin-arginine translocase subunit TatC [Microbacterium sp. T32]|uniref:twin-arginine translocase subunit TatC n=1 Tax=Microbacterium sp. T32 TaxID=1776083 RepID=UPI0007ABAD32|nr:twin-arginine translocase subunit TatC [Microbacterium sp. T32]KZE42507.1 preprotein translocase subunit TatC [Microbacterium sp. T32]